MNIQEIEVLLQQVDTDERASPRMLIHIGDISYARGLPYTWEWFFQQVSAEAVARNSISVVFCCTIEKLFLSF